MFSVSACPHTTAVVADRIPLRPGFLSRGVSCGEAGEPHAGRTGVATAAARSTERAETCANRGEPNGARDRRHDASVSAMVERPIELAKNGAAHLLAACEAALEGGEIDEAEWYRRIAAVITPAYLAADTPWAQSGKSGDAASWERARSL